MAEIGSLWQIRVDYDLFSAVSVNEKTYHQKNVQTED